MINIQLAKEAAIEGILSTGILGTAPQEAARLVEAWIEQYSSFPEREWKVIATESPFYIQLAEKFYVVGMMDGTFEDEVGLLTSEWKSRREPKKTKEGKNYKGDDEDGWLEEISNGPQLAVYALAAKEGYFGLPKRQYDIRTDSFKDTTFEKLSIQQPRILVRAVVKSTPAEIWPQDWRKGLFSFPPAVLRNAENALVSQAVMIRAGRKRGLVPWTLPGIHCQNMYRRTCSHLINCQNRITPPIEPKDGRWLRGDETDPGFVIVKLLDLDPFDPELVVLSQSALTNYYWCNEKGRIDGGGYFPLESDINLDIGQCLHTGLAEFYRKVVPKE